MNKLKGIVNTQDAGISETLSQNFIKFYENGLLNAGGFYNVNIPSSGLYGGDKHKLKVRKDPNYSNGRVWEGFRKNWVWETGVEYARQPIQISGVFVNNTFQPGTGVGTYAHDIDYNNGRVVFDTAISTTATVQLAYSYKHHNVIPSEGIPWLREIQQGSFRLDNDNYSFFASGDWANLAQTRIQLPTIAVEVSPNHQLSPYQLGGGQNVRTDIIYYVFTENHSECKTLLDIISYQNDRDISMFDPNKVAISGVYPLNGVGQLNTNALPSGLYANMVNDFPHQRCTIENTRGSSVTELSNNLWYGTIRSTATVIMTNI